MSDSKTMRLLTLTVSIVIIASASLSSITAFPDAEYKENNLEFDIKIKFLMKINHIPSLVICIIRNNSIVFMKPYGYTNYYLRKKAMNDNIFLVGSISKTITATALMQLYEKGLFDLDDDISNYLQFEIKNPRYPDVNITFRMLLSHQASLDDFGLHLRDIPNILYTAHCENASYSLLEEMLVPGKRFYNERYFLDYLPGEEARYCELNYAIAGYLVERISGVQLEEYCQENIFKPLNMTNTSFSTNNLNQRKLVKPYALILTRLIPFYSKRSIPFNPIVTRLMPLPKYDFQFLDPPAGLWTKAEDLSHFLIAHMNGGVCNGERILEENSVNIMHKLHYPNSTDTLLANFMGGQLKLQHGLGWFFINLLDVKLEGHAGASPGYNCHMYVVNCTNNEKAGLILLSNGPILGPAAFLGRFSVNKYMKLLEVILQKTDELQTS